MNKIFLALIAYCLFTLSAVEGLFSFSTSYAASPTPTESEKKDVIGDLKERIASRVAQLKLVERRGIIGTVTDASDTQITLSDISGNTRFIDVDELTKFASPSAKDTSFGISDIQKGNMLGILGLYNKQSRRTLARFVDVVTLPKFIHGAVGSIDEEGFSFKVTTDDQKLLIVDVEKVTKTLSYTKKGKLEKSGFSKIEVGEHIIIVGFSDLKDKTKIIASRVLIFPEIPKNPKIIISNEEVTVSTGSGKKLTPITR